MSNRFLNIALVLATLALLASSIAGAAEPPVRYELGFERPDTHLMDVTIHTTELKGPDVEFAMPAWSPGSYNIQNYAGNIQRFRATGTDGKTLRWHKADSQTWRIDLAGSSALTVSYQVFGDTLRNNQAQYNELHAFIGGPSVWMYLVGGKERPVELSIAVPPDWKVATGMDHTSDHTFRAADYDWFADAPLEISHFSEKQFQVLGTTYHMIVHDVEGGKDFTKATQDIQKFVEIMVPMFKSVTGGEQAAPFKDYWFLFHIWPNTGGGLEHLNSTQIDFSSDWDSMDPVPDYGNQYNLKLFVCAHEFFHAWNVKRLRPRPLGPFDYSQMVHTPSLWISEGLTSYYGSLVLERAGLITPQQYLDGIASLITKFEQEPGRQERSIEDTSWDAWFNGTTISQGNNLRNTSYSYYDGGQVMGHILDFAIRQNTHNQKSLDDWMSLLYSRYALPKPGFEPEDAIKAASDVAGSDMSSFFHLYISGKEPIPYDQYFAYAGITVEKKLDPAKAWLGASHDNSDKDHLKIGNVIPGSPAEMAGLDRDDVVLAVDERSVDENSFPRVVSEHKPGDTIHITVIRLGKLKEIPVTLTADPRPIYSLKPMEHPTDQQKAIYNSWMGIK